MKKIIVSVIMLLLVVSMSTVVFAGSDMQSSTHTVYFGSGLTDVFSTASCTISVDSSYVNISNYTSTPYDYDVIMYEMELMKYENGSWTVKRTYSATAYNTDYLYGSRRVYVSAGSYKLRTYHYIYSPGDEDDTYTYTQSVTVP